MEMGLDLKIWSWSWNWSWNLRSWNWSWSWNLRSWSWSWSWYSGDLPELELELELKLLELELELELIFWRLAGVGVGVGVETSGVGVGVDIMELTPTLLVRCISMATYGIAIWLWGTMAVDKSWINIADFRLERNTNTWCNKLFLGPLPKYLNLISEYLEV